MKRGKAAAAGILAAVLFFVHMAAPVKAEEKAPGNLYSLSAVLMDGDSGRVLYGKKADVPRPNASTTKVLTCILALENAPGDDYVKVSQNAASQPEVKLYLREGEQYYMEDLLYSLMLKSHNDTAVAIAEHVGGSVEGFSRMMNEKAKKIGCESTHFITPNGLDAVDHGGEHRTTARDLALIMRYAIQNEIFLKITQTREYSFWDIEKKRQFHVQNANALFDMTEGVLSGKTGFTGNAGYCYVCAVEKEERIFIIALLGCGWPNNKNYKWKDTKLLLQYGEENFEYKTLWKEPDIPKICVKDGISKEEGFQKKAYVGGRVSITEKERNRKILVRKKQKVTMETKFKKELSAPVKKGQKIGEVTFCLDGKKLISYPVLAKSSVEKLTYRWYAQQVFQKYFH